jgi:hypothetical protein
MPTNQAKEPHKTNRPDKTANTNVSTANAHVSNAGENQDFRDGRLLTRVRRWRGSGRIVPLCVGIGPAINCDDTIPWYGRGLACRAGPAAGRGSTGINNPAPLQTVTAHVNAQSSPASSLPSTCDTKTGTAHGDTTR